MRRWLQRQSKNPASEDPAVSASASNTAIATSPRKPFPSGIKLLHNPEHSVVDIILVHGLTGDREKTWTAKNAAAPWPQTLLPSRVPNARVLTFGYDAYVANWQGMVSKNRIGNHSMNLLTAVATYREDDNTNNRPIIFICHSLGGLVCEDALSAARQRPERHLQNILDYTRGIVFLGTPHHGAGLAKCAEILATLIGLLKQTNPQILAVLESDSEVLARVQDGFHTMVRSRNQERLQPIEITCFYEELPIPGVGVVVPSHSAILPGYIPIGIRSNHMGMTKFEHVDDPGFTAITGELRRWVKEMTPLSNASAPGAERSEQGKQVRQEDGTQCTGAISYGNMHWMVPRAINDLFTGRTELLLRMQKALHSDNTSCADGQKRFVLTGLGGQGKSEICLQVATLMREEFYGVFWVDVSRPSIAESDFITVAKLLGRSAESVHDALQVLATTKQSWFLILDNADDPDFDYQVYLPSGTQGAVIITSRVTECRRYSPDKAEALEGLEDQDSKELLLKAADLPRKSWSPYNSQAQEVVRLLGSHTLALIQADAYIRQGHCQLDQYPEVYRRQRKRLLKYQPKQAQSRYCDVYATFEASADVLEQSKSEAAKDALRLLEILSMLDSGILPLQTFQDAWDGGREVTRTNRREANEIDAMSIQHLSRLPGFVGVDGNEWDPYRLIEASSLLVSLSLVTRHDLEGLPGLSMHPLTHAWAKDRQDSEQQVVAWITAGCALALSRSNTHTWQTQERRLLPHMQSYLDIEISKALSYEFQAIVVPILLQYGWALLSMRQDSRLGRLLEDIFIKLERTPERPLKESLPLYNLQARNLIHLGKNKKAVALLEQVVKINETILAKEHTSRLASQDTLAIAYRANGQVKEAVELLEQVVKIRETTLAVDHPNRLNSQHELAIAYRANGQVKEAVELLEQVVKIRETTLAVDHPEQLNSQHELALAYQANGQVKEAVELLEQVVKIKQSKLRDSHPSRVVSEEALAYCLQDRQL